MVGADFQYFPMDSWPGELIDEEVVALKAENARLKEALRGIRDAKTYGECAVAVEKAREVLGDASA